MVNIELDDLVDMMVHKCHYCSFIEAGQCSQNNGCRKGIETFLKKEFGIKDEVCDS